MLHFTREKVQDIRDSDKRSICAVDIVYLCEDWLKLYRLLGEAVEREAKLLALVGRIA